MKLSVQQVLITYSAVLSTTFAVVLLMGAKPHRGQAFDVIQVHRINIVEPDGTLRMVISDRDRVAWTHREG
jgi:voltage-gated potassium channel Kch